MNWDRPMFYRRDGTPYPPGEAGMAEWIRDFENNVVRQDRLPDGSFISTIWIGIDRDHRSVILGLEHKPMIFETLTWDSHDEVVDSRRWRTEEEAIAGHAEAVTRQARKIAHEQN